MEQNVDVFESSFDEVDTVMEHALDVLVRREVHFLKVRSCFFQWRFWCRFVETIMTICMAA